MFTPSHVIVYCGPTNPPQIASLRGQLSFINQPQQPQQGIIHIPSTGLLIVLSSWGGSTFEARALYGLIRSLSYPVEIHAVGVVASAAVPLMLAADRRTADPHAQFLFHAWTWGTPAHPGYTPDEMQLLPAQLEDDVRWGEAIFEERTNLSAKEVSEMQLCQRPRIEGAQFALKHGFVHEVVERKIPHGLMTWNIA